MNQRKQEDPNFILLYEKIFSSLLEFNWTLTEWMCVIWESVRKLFWGIRSCLTKKKNRSLLFHWWSGYFLVLHHPPSFLVLSKSTDTDSSLYVTGKLGFSELYVSYDIVCSMIVHIWFEVYEIYFRWFYHDVDKKVNES